MAVQLELAGHNTYSNTHTPSPGDQPTPYSRGTTTGFKRIDQSRCNRGEGTADTDGKREGGQIAKLSLEDWLVAEFSSKSFVGLGEVVDGHTAHTALCIADFDVVDALLTLAELLWGEVGDAGAMVLHGRCFWVGMLSEALLLGGGIS